MSLKKKDHDVSEQKNTMMSLTQKHDHDVSDKKNEHDASEKKRP